MILAAVAAMAMGVNAQVLKNNFMNGYSVGDKLEKAQYADKGESIKQDTWCNWVGNKPDETPCASIGEALSYDGYPEGGLSIQLGGHPTGTKGAHMSIYSMTDGKEYARNVFYLPFLCNFSKIGSNGLADIIGLCPSYISGANRVNVYVMRNGSTGMKFGVGILKEKAEGAEVFDLNKTHLCVLKVDYPNQKVSLYVDPDLSAGEPEVATAEMEAPEGSELKHAIRGITLRNRAGFKGNVGNFRWCKGWESIVAEAE